MSKKDGESCAPLTHRRARPSLLRTTASAPAALTLAFRQCLRPLAAAPALASRQRPRPHPPR
eukprot:362706-Chlamydomonas_euryale.AAC.4